MKKLLEAASSVLALLTQSIPLVGSGESALLDALHLPRFWLKNRMQAAGILRKDYPACGQGFDTMVLERLGVSPQEAAAVIQENRLSYVAFIQWVESRPGVKLHSNSVRALNSAVQGYEHPVETRQGILKECGLSLDAEGLTTAVELNELEDLNAASDWLMEMEMAVARLAEAIGEAQAAEAASIPAVEEEAQLAPVPGLSPEVGANVAGTGDNAAITETASAEAPATPHDAAVEMEASHRKEPAAEEAAVPA